MVIHQSCHKDILEACPCLVMRHYCKTLTPISSCSNMRIYVHSISTLANESFFSDLTRLDKESPFYPKACNIPKLVGKVVQLNYYKHKANKSYSLQPTAKGTYPVHVFDQELTSETGNTQHIYKNHFFDIVDTHTSYRPYKTDLSTGLNPHKGVHSVCRYYRTDESTVDP